MDITPKTPKKIILVVTKGNWGGAQRYVFDIATSLPKPDFDVLVAYGEGDILSKKLEENGIISKKIPSLVRDISILKDFSSFRELIKLFRSEKPDIIHLNSSKIGGLGALAGRICGIKKIIFTVHGFAFNENRSWIQKKTIRFLSWLTIFLSTDAICISKSEFNLAKKWFFVQNKIHFIPNGISSPDFTDRETARKTILEKIGRTEEFLSNKNLVVSVGELTKNKGYEYAIPAFKKLPNFAYVIIGAGEERVNLEKIIIENNLSDRVALTGFIASASSLLKSADIFLLSSIKEGLPYVILEAGFANLPVISTRSGGIPDVIENNVSGILVNPRDSEAISNAISLFGSDKNFRELCAFKLNKNIITNNGKENMTTSTALIYNKAI